MQKIPFRVPWAQTSRLLNHIAISRGCEILTCGLNLFITTCKHSLLLIFALTYSAYCSGMSRIEVFFGTFVKPKPGGVVRTLSLPSTVHGHNFRRQISVHKFPSTDNFRRHLHTHDTHSLLALRARMNEQKLRPKSPSKSQKLRPKTPSESQKLRSKTLSKSQKLKPIFL